MIRHPPKSPLFPYTPLFRSVEHLAGRPAADDRALASDEPKLLQRVEQRVQARQPQGADQTEVAVRGEVRSQLVAVARPEDRKSTRLNSSHLVISYAVFCLKK